MGSRENLVEDTLLCHFDSLVLIQLPKNRWVVTFEMPVLPKIRHRTFRNGSFRQDP